MTDDAEREPLPMSLIPRASARRRSRECALSPALVIMMCFGALGIRMNDLMLMRVLQPGCDLSDDRPGSGRATSAGGEIAP